MPVSDPDVIPWGFVLFCAVVLWISHLRQTWPRR